MTITNTTDTVSFTGDGSTAAFAYTFPTKLSSDLVVTYKVTSTGAETVLTETTHYTATVGDSGGTVTTTAVPSGLTHPIPSTATVHVTRVTPKTQATDLALGGAFSPEVLEDAYDKNTKLAIENFNNGQSALRFPATETETTLLPNSVDRASKYLSFDSSGNATVSAGTTETVTHSTWGSELVGLTQPIYWTSQCSTPHDLDVLIGTDMSGVTDAVIYVDADCTLSSNSTTGASIKWAFMPGAKITQASSATLTINGPFGQEYNHSQLFSGFAKGDVTFGRGSVEFVRPDWWQENTTPGTTVMTTACNIACNLSLPVRLLPTHYLASILHDTGTTSLRGAGGGSESSPTAAGLPMIEAENSGEYAWTERAVAAGASWGVTLLIQDVVFNGNSTDKGGFVFGDPTTYVSGDEALGRVTIQRCTFLNCTRGIYHPWGNIGNRYYDNLFRGGDYGIFMEKKTGGLQHIGANKIEGGQFNSQDVAALYLDNSGAGITAGQTHVKDVVFQGINGFAIFVEDYAGFYGPLSFDGCWFETNAKLKKTITGITLSSGVVVSILAVAHGMSTGDKTNFGSVGGTTELNGNNYTITKTDDDNFTLDGTDGDNFTAWTSLGSALPWITVESVQYENVNMRIKDTDSLVIYRCNIEDMVLVNSHVTEDSCCYTTADNASTVDSTSSRDLFDIAAAGGSIAGATVHSYANQLGSNDLGDSDMFLIAPRTHDVSSAIGGTSILSDSYAGHGRKVFTGTASVNTETVADGVIHSTCGEITVTASRTEFPSGGDNISYTSGKWYAYSAAFKMTSATQPTTLSASNTSQFFGNQASKLVQNQWVHLGGIQLAGATSTSAFPYIVTQAGNTLVLRIADLQVVEFDTFAEAKAFFNTGGYLGVSSEVGLLSCTTLDVQSTGQTTLYTVPAGRRLIIDKIMVVAGATASPTAVVTFGEQGTATDFLAAQTFTNLAAQYDTIVCRPVPNATPVKLKSYPAASIIEADVTTADADGGTDNQVFLYGTLY